ncbi:hypothetical protein DAERI_030146 [Deinococcus aerius]|uniref:Outer membrane protein beta-barrel domain-containing protein n=1 Tax=Deinococcus aerius TaxID=200253 RepID=A0A2I9D3Z6_9DEIO|nr:hypothetical protein [Deinococcus aerius]GBF04980.1 hypothetical protein DAERI_030146 [Deinococcus aerius]
MKKVLALTLCAGLATAGAQTTTTTISATPVTAGLNGVELGLTGGYANGLSGEVFVHVPNVAGPFGVKAGVALTRPSDALNDNAKLTNSGTDADLTFGDLKRISGATESGSHTIFSLDGTYNLGEVSPGLSTTLYAGGRYGMFRSNVTSEDDTTTYSSNEFGIGAGVMVSYPLTGNLSLVGDLGVDQFFKSTINIRSSDGTTNDSIPTSDPSYAGFDDLFVQPGTVFKARIGIKTTF